MDEWHHRKPTTTINSGNPQPQAEASSAAAERERDDARDERDRARAEGERGGAREEELRARAAEATAALAVLPHTIWRQESLHDCFNITSKTESCSNFHPQRLKEKGQFPRSSSLLHPTHFCLTESVHQVIYISHPPHKSVKISFTITNMK